MGGGRGLGTQGLSDLAGLYRNYDLTALGYLAAISVVSTRTAPGWTLKNEGVVGHCPDINTHFGEVTKAEDVEQVVERGRATG